MKSCYKQICLICTSRSTKTYYNLYQLWFACNYSFANKNWYQNWYDIMNKKTVNLKLQNRISKTHSALLISTKCWVPKRIKVTIFVRCYLSSRPEVFLEFFQYSQENTCAEVFFLMNLQAWRLQIFLEHLFCMWLSYVIQKSCSRKFRKIHGKFYLNGCLWY